MHNSMARFGSQQINIARLLPLPLCRLYLMTCGYHASQAGTARALTCTVGMRGSVQLSTMPWFTNQVSLRLDSTVYTKDSLRHGCSKKEAGRSEAGQHGSECSQGRHE